MTRKVGYASPPLHSQWKPGQSGNPNGRKKGSKNLITDLMEELAENIQVTEGGRLKRISKQRALIKALLTKAMKGDVRAASVVIAWTARLLTPDPAADEEAPLTFAEQAVLDDLLGRSATSPRRKNDGGAS